MVKTFALPDVPEHVEHRIALRDGRTLAIAEWGDPHGVPAFSLHGTPGGRVSWWNDLSIYERHGLRRLTVDRPGYGESTRRPGRSVADFVDDIEAAADALGIGSFAVSGGSGGGPHCLAVAALLPDRVLRCMASVSIAPYGERDLDWVAGMTEGNVIEFNAALAGEAAMREVAEREREFALAQLSAGRADFTSDAYTLPPADLEQMERHRASLAAQMLHGLAHNADGWVDDNLAFVKPWGFEVATIRVPVRLDYGRDDTLVPAAHGDWLAAHVPGAVVKVLAAGHMGDDATVEQDMAWLAGGA